MYKLTKLSRPGWVKSYETVGQLTEEVSRQTCSLCKASYGTSLEEILVSDCALEYEVEGGVVLCGVVSFEGQLQDIADRAA